MKRVGIIGFGHFGKLAAEVLSEHCEVIVFSRHQENVPENLRASLADVCKADYIIPCVPLGSYEAVLTEVAQHIAPTAVLVDICSVKVKPMQIISKLLPNNKAVATHPLFGPETFHTKQDLTVVLCEDASGKEQLEYVDEFCHAAGLSVVRMSTQEHDQQMAKVHALTFFIAKVLNSMELDDVTLLTPSFERLLGLAGLDAQESDDLLQTIQLGNPFASEVRNKFVSKTRQLAEDLDNPAESAHKK